MPSILTVTNLSPDRVVIGGALGRIEPFATRIEGLTAQQLEEIQTSLTNLKRAGLISCVVSGDAAADNDKAEYVTRFEIKNAPSSVALGCQILLSRNEYPEAQILAGFLPEVYGSALNLPSPPPTGVGTPAFAVVEDENGFQIAYWDLAGAWVLTSCPWANPILLAGHVIDQLPGIGSGVNNWQFAMGPEIRILQANTNIRDLSVKLGNAGLTHTWAIRQSTVSGPTAPALNTYTTVLATGVYTNTAANVWENVTGFATVGPLQPDDWIVAQVWPGFNAGQLFNISAGRTELNEDYGFVNGGTFVFQGGANPGTTAPPTNRAPNTIYGLCSVDLGP